MQNVTTIQVKKETLDALKKAKEYPRQSYDELILRMSKMFGRGQRPTQYDRFLHQIQQAKMRELWDNKYDEVWEHA